MRQYINQNDGFRFIVTKHYFSGVDRGFLPTYLVNTYLDTTICPR